MKRRSSLLGMIAFGLSLFFSVACSSQVTTPTPDNIATRVQEEKLVAATLTAQAPTSTPAPTNTATPMPPTATATQIPSTPTPISTTGRIDGKVFLVATNSGIGDVDVSLYESKNKEKSVAETKTDAQGKFSFAEVKPGNYYILDIGKQRSELKEHEYSSTV